PAPPTTTIFSTPAACARRTTSPMSAENSGPWMCAWLSISLSGAPSGGMSGFAFGLDAREQNRRRRDFMARGEKGPARLAGIRLAGGDREKPVQLPRGVGKKRRQQARAGSDHLEQMVQDLSHARALRLVFEQRERRGLHDVAVGVVDRAPERFERAMELQRRHVLLHLFFRLD